MMSDAGNVRALRALVFESGPRPPDGNQDVLGQIFRELSIRLMARRKAMRHRSVLAQDSIQGIGRNLDHREARSAFSFLEPRFG
jgi:hypothetical protein